LREICRVSTDVRMITELREEDFRQKIIEYSAPTVVLFYMRECPYCKQFLPLFSKLSGNIPTKIAQVDISSTNSPLWDDYNIEAVPTVIAFKDGKIHARADAVRHVGLTTEHIEEMIHKNPDFFA
jgi:thioredoxin-like negative regulator of GroEL